MVYAKVFNGGNGAVFRGDSISLDSTTEDVVIYSLKLKIYGEAWAPWLSLFFDRSMRGNSSVSAGAIDLYIYWYDTLESTRRGGPV